MFCPAYARVSVPENNTSRVVQGDASAVAGAQFFSERKKIVDHLIGFNVWFGDEFSGYDRFKYV